MKITFLIDEVEAAIEKAKHSDPIYEPGRSASSVKTVDLTVPGKPVREDWALNIFELLQVVKEVFTDGKDSETNQGPWLQIHDEGWVVVHVWFKGSVRKITITAPDLCYTVDERLAFFKTAKDFLNDAG